MSEKVKSTPVAVSIPFDNSSNGFTAGDVQAAIEEAKAAATTGVLNIPELTSDPISPVAEQAWVLKSVAIVGSPIGLLLSLTQERDTYKFSYKTHEGSIVRVVLG